MTGAANASTFRGQKCSEQDLEKKILVSNGDNQGGKKRKSYALEEQLPIETAEEAEQEAL
jgi:hypothetical protein